MVCGFYHYYSVVETLTKGYNSSLESLSHRKLSNKRVKCQKLLAKIKVDAQVAIVNIKQRSTSQSYPTADEQVASVNSLVDKLQSYISSIDEYLSYEADMRTCITCSRSLTLDHYKLDTDGDEYYITHNICVHTRYYNIQCNLCYKHNIVKFTASTCQERVTANTKDHVLTDIASLTTGYSSSIDNVSHSQLSIRLVKCTKLLEVGEPLLAKEIISIQHKINTNHPLGPYETSYQQQVVNINDQLQSLRIHIDDIKHKLDKPEPKQKCIVCKVKYSLDNFVEMINNYYNEHNLANCPHEYEYICVRCEIDDFINDINKCKDSKKEKDINSNNDSKLQNNKKQVFVGCYYEHKGGCDSHPYPCKYCNVKFCSCHQSHKHKCKNSWCNKELDSWNGLGMCKGCYSLHMRVNGLDRSGRR